MSHFPVTPLKSHIDFLIKEAEVDTPNISDINNHMTYFSEILTRTRMSFREILFQHQRNLENKVG